MSGVPPLLRQDDGGNAAGDNGDMTCFDAYKIWSAHDLECPKQCAYDPKNRRLLQSTSSFRPHAGFFKVARFLDEDCPAETFNTQNACSEFASFCAEERCLACNHCDSNDREENRCPECVADAGDEEGTSCNHNGM